MAMEDDRPPAPELEAREPSIEDLVGLCRELNRQSARYVVVGGFAIRAAGYGRRTILRHWFEQQGQSPPKMGAESP
jgi:hypothetical protein